MQARTITLLFGILIFFNAHGNDRIDSLLYELDNCPDSSRYTILTNIADQYYYNHQIELSASYYKKAADLSETVPRPDLRHISESYGNYGYCLAELGRYKDAIINYNKALKAATQNFDSTEIATQYSNMGISYFLMGNYEKSIENYQKALKIDQALNIPENIGIDYSIIGNVFATWNKHKNAIIFFRDALSIARHLNNPEQISTRLNKLGSSYIALERYDSALIYLQESMSIVKKLKNNNRIAMVQNQIGFAYQKSGNYELAMSYYDSALTFTKGDIKTEAILNSNICENCILKGDYKKAEGYCEKGLSSAKEIGLMQTVMKNYKLLGKIYYRTERYKKAYEFFELYSICKDSVFTQESQRKLAEFQTVFETEKKDAEIKLLNSAKTIQDVEIKKAEQRLYFFIIISVLMIILFGLFYYQYIERKKVNTILADKNEQLGQLNSTKDKFISIIAHDLKNPFSAFTNISSALFFKKSKLSENEADQLTASLYHSSIKVKEMLNSLLDWARLQKDNLDVTLESIHLYEVVAQSIDYSAEMALNKHVTILNQVSQDIYILTNKNTILTVLNNLLTNAIKFGFENQPVIISSTTYHNQIDLIVEDHGIGLTKNEVSQLFRIDVDTRKIGSSTEKGTGMGLILCKELLEKIDGKINVESVPNNGSRFIVSIQLVK